MQTPNKKYLFLLASLFAASAAPAAPFTLTSESIAHGQPLHSDQVFNGFGCSGGNRSPQLSWFNAPKNTKAFAVFSYDPDAPTGSGWWHWQLVNIPVTVRSLVAGVGAPNNTLIPNGSQQTKNDYGLAGFGGACPPTGHGLHRYQFTVYALSEVLDLPQNASPALTGFMVKAHALDSATIEAVYKRD